MVGQPPKAFNSLGSRWLFLSREPALVSAGGVARLAGGIDEKISQLIKCPDCSVEVAFDMYTDDTLTCPQCGRLVGRGAEAKAMAKEGGANTPDRKLPCLLLFFIPYYWLAGKTGTIYLFAVIGMASIWASFGFGWGVFLTVGYNEIQRPFLTIKEGLLNLTTDYQPLRCPVKIGNRI